MKWDAERRITHQEDAAVQGVTLLPSLALDGVERVAGMTPQIRSEVVGDFFAQRECVFWTLENGDHGGTGPGHQRPADFLLILQPALHFGQKQVLLKNGAFQIIDQAAPGKLLWLVRNPGNRLGICPIFIRRRGADPEWRLDEEQRQCLAKVKGLHPFPASITPRRAAMEKERHVGADRGCEFREIFHGHLCLIKRVEGLQDRGGITRSASQPGTVRDFFQQAYPQLGHETAFVAEKLGSFNDQIIRTRKGRIATRKLNAVRICKINFDSVEDGDWDHQSLDFMEAIQAFVKDAEG